MLPSPYLTIGVAAPVATLNPVELGTSEEVNFSNLIWSGLLGVNARGAPFPMLARQVPSYKNGLISPDGLRIIFHLRPHVKWSDGRPITARDVRFGWQLATQSWADTCSAVCPAIHDVVVDSPTRVTFELSRPFAPLLFDLPPVLPRHFVWKGTWRRTESFLFQPATTWLSPRFPVDGPYQAITSTNASVTFLRNTQWSLFHRPKLASIRVSWYTSDTLLMSAVQSGDVDIAQGFDINDIPKGIINPAQLGRLSLHMYPLGGIEHFEPNVRISAPYSAPLSDVRVRQALNLMIPRAKIIQYSLGIPLSLAQHLVAYSPEMPGRFDGLAVPGMWDPIKHHFVTTIQPRDANLLLREAGWTLRGQLRYRRGCSSSVCQLSLLELIPKTYVDRIDEAQFLQSPEHTASDNVTGSWGKREPNRWQAESLGIHTILNYTQYAVGNLIAPYRQNGPCAKGKFDLCLFAQLPGYDPQTDFQLEFTSRHDSRKNKGLTDINFPGIHDPTLDRIFGRAATTYDLSARRSLYRAWQLRVAKRAYWLPVYYQPFIVVQRRRVANFRPSHWGAEWNAWQLG